MNWLPGVFIAAAMVAYLLFKRLALVQPGTVRECLKNGGKVIDVRTEAEFQQGHVAGAINLPLDRLHVEIGRYVPNKQQPVLLHCLSGGRSALGAATLKKLGYTSSYNLGSLARATKLVGNHYELDSSPQA